MNSKLSAKRKKAILPNRPKSCKKCGGTKFWGMKRGYWRCAQCHHAKRKVMSKQRRLERKVKRDGWAAVWRGDR